MRLRSELLKGSAQTLAAEKMTALLRDLELQAANGSLAGAPELVELIDMAFAEACRAPAGPEEVADS